MDTYGRVTVATNGSGGGGGMTLLSHQTTTGGETSITFSSIPASYTHLELRATCATTTNNSGFTDTIYARCNGDTGNNYDWTLLGSYGGGTSFGGGAATTAQMGLGFASANGTSGVAGKFASTIAIMNNYLNTAHSKWFNNQTSGYQGNVGILQATSGGVWNSTAAVTQIDVLLLGGVQFAVGSEFWLYAY